MFLVDLQYVLIFFFSGLEGRKKVPSARKWKNRLCEQFETWLKRGTFTEGDSVVFGDDTTVKDAHDEKLRRREEIEWKEKVMDRILGVQRQQTESYAVSSYQETGFDLDPEMDSEYNLEEGDKVEDELETSIESIITHIR